MGGGLCKVSLLGVGFVVGVVLHVPLRAAPAGQPVLEAPNKEAIYKPNDSIVVRLPGLPAKTRTRLSFEVDDVDVTELVTWHRHTATFSSPQPLAWGRHQLRVVENAEDGSIVERGNWTFEVRQTHRFREASLQTNMTLNLTRRVADDNLADPPDKNQADGGARLDGKLVGESWRFNGAADLLYNSQEILMPRETSTDVGGFLFTGSNEVVDLKAGHHTIEPNSLLMRNFTRRGASTTYHAAPGSTDLTGFAMSTRDIYGFQQGLGIGDPDKRVQGVTLTSRPVRNQASELLVSTTYLDGEGQDQLGAGISGDPTASAGSAAGLVLDSYFFARRLRLKGEYARTDFDFDGVNTGFDAEEDNAYSLAAVYLPWQDKLVNDLPLSMQFGLEKTRVGTFFRSLANPAGISDRDLIRGTAKLTWAGLNIDLAYGQEEDNVNNLDILVSTKTDRNVVTASYSPGLYDLSPASAEEDKKNRFLGLPTYALSWQRADRELQCDTCTAPLSDSLLDTQSLSFSATFVYDSWDWAIGHTRGELEDDAGLQPDTESILTELSNNIHIGEKLTVSAYVQWLKAKNRATDDEDDGRALGLNLGYAFTDKLYSGIGYSTNRDSQPGDPTSPVNPVLPVDIEITDVTANLVWTVRHARGKKPGVALSLDGHRQTVEDRLINDTQEAYQVFFKIGVSWAPGF